MDSTEIINGREIKHQPNIETFLRPQQPHKKKNKIKYEIKFSINSISKDEIEKKIKKRLNLSNLRIRQPAKPVNKFMNFITFLLNYFFNYMRKK